MKGISIRSLSAVFALLALTAAEGRAVVPQTFAPVLAVKKPSESFMLLSVTGTGFGKPLPYASLLFVTKAGGAFAFWCNDPNIVEWNDKQIVVKLPPTTAPLQAGVVTSGGTSNWSNTDTYQYDTFDTDNGPSASFNNPAPNGVAVDDNGRVWIVEEFGNDLKYWDPAQQQVVKAPCAECAAAHIQPNTIPRGTGLGPYYNQWNNSDGEDIDIDSYGRVWFIHGGAANNQHTYQNHSRIISYDPRPSTPELNRFRIWNVPGDHNEAAHLAWGQGGYLWFSQNPRQQCSGTGQCGPTIRPAQLVTFSPDGNAGFVPPSNQFNYEDFVNTAGVTCPGYVYSPTAATIPGTCSNMSSVQCYGKHDCAKIGQICAPTNPWTFSCYKTYDVPDAGWMTEMEVDDAGGVWFANYELPNDKTFVVGRLNPSDGSIMKFPSPITDPIHAYTQLLWGNGGWDLQINPDGDPVFSEFFSARIARIDGSQATTNPQCQHLLWPDSSDCTAAGDPSCTNPCIEELDMPNICERDINGECSTPCGSPGACWDIYGCMMNSTGQCVRVADKTVKDIAFHPNGTTWFTENALGGSADPNSTATIGIVDQNWQRIVLFPPFSTYNIQYNGAYEVFAASGLAIDSRLSTTAPDIWFTDYRRRQLSRLRKIS